MQQRYRSWPGWRCRSAQPTCLMNPGRAVSPSSRCPRIWCQPKLEQFFGSATAAFDVDAVYGGANIVKPDFIRVEADEATYNMHIMVRFEIERALMSGDLARTGD